MTTIGSLCSGYEGLGLAVQAVLGGRIAWVADVDPDASRVLAHRLPGVPNHGDITACDWTAMEPVDVVVAGYPCQPFSHAGKRKGIADERHLWPYVADAVRLLRPQLVVLENVAGHVSLGLDVVLGDLAALGFDAEWIVVRAADAGAPHGRARMFLVAADADDRAVHGEWARPQPGPGGAAAADPDRERQQRHRGARGRRGGSADHDLAAPDSDGPGREGGQPAGRRDVSARGAAPHAAGSGGTYVALGGSAAGQQERPVAGAGGRDRGGADATRVHGDGQPAAVVEWGVYEPAIRRWERVLGRPAPRPTEPAPRRRLTLSRSERQAAEWDVLGYDGWLDRHPEFCDAGGFLWPYGRRADWDAVAARGVGTTRRPLPPRPDAPPAHRLSPRFVEWMQGLPAGWVTDVPGLSRNAMLRLLGNGVVPQQAELALRLLLPRLADVEAGAA